jgi:excisionase family DNA binding protein
VIASPVSFWNQIRVARRLNVLTDREFHSLNSLSKENGDAMKEVGFENPVTSRIAAPLVGVHYKTLERMARAGNVPATKIGKSWLFRLSALSTWFDTELQSNVTNHSRR